jgi:hypothetical protein
VEYLAQVYQTFTKEVSDLFAENNLFDVLLYWFRCYAFHNILHAKVAEIFVHALDKNYPKTVKFIMEETQLVNMILILSNHQAVLTFERSNNTSTKGYMCYVRKLANKIIEMQKLNPDISDYLETIPEWGLYLEKELDPVNQLEAKPLASDPRSKSFSANIDEDLEFLFRPKPAGVGQKQNHQQKSAQNKKLDDSDENVEDEQHDFEQT